MLTETPTLQLLLDVVGVSVFALSGALVAVRRGLDLFGVLVLSWITGLGGGITRDVLLGLTPPVGVTDARLLAAAVVPGALVFFLHGVWLDLADEHPDVSWRRVPRLVRVLDAVGLSVFAVSGALVALGSGAAWLTAIIVGGITAVGGGLLRDLLSGRVPEVLQRELYAIPALAGAALVVLFDALGVLSSTTAWGAAALVFAVRMTAVTLDLNAPQPLRGRRRRDASG